MAYAATEQWQTTENAWNEYASSITTALDHARGDEATVASQLQPAALHLYQALAGSAAFGEQLSGCPRELGGSEPTWASVLFESEAIKAGLLAVYRDKPVPLHDHPGCGAVVFVLSGAVHFQYANIHSDNGCRVELEIARIRNRLPGQVCWFTATERNIHRVEALTDKAIMLVAHVPHIDTGKQHLYFPITGYEPVEGNRFLAHRMRLVRDGSNTHSIN